MSIDTILAYPIISTVIAKFIVSIPAVIWCVAWYAKGINTAIRTAARSDFIPGRKAQ